MGDGRPETLWRRRGAWWPGATNLTAHRGQRCEILDEPTQGLADSEIAEFITLVRGLAGEMTILLIEHNINVVMQTADAITVLNSGRVLAEGTPDEIRANAAVQAAYLGTG